MAPRSVRSHDATLGSSCFEEFRYPNRWQTQRHHAAEWDRHLGIRAARFASIMRIGSEKTQIGEELRQGCGGPKAPSSNRTSLVDVAIARAAIGVSVVGFRGDSEVCPDRGCAESMVGAVGGDRTGQDGSDDSAEERASGTTAFTYVAPTLRSEPLRPAASLVDAMGCRRIPMTMRVLPITKGTLYLKRIIYSFGRVVMRRELDDTHKTQGGERLRALPVK
jgi:hypothetical protein